MSSVTPIDLSKCQPLSDRLILKIDKAKDATKGGIVLPDCSKDRPHRGTVISVGPGIHLESGERSPLTVKPGDRVLFSRFTGDSCGGDEDHVILREGDILAIITEEDD